MKVNIKSRFDRDFMKRPSPDSKKILYNQKKDVPDAGGRGEVEKRRSGEVEKRRIGEAGIILSAIYPPHLSFSLAVNVTDLCYALFM